MRAVRLRLLSGPGPGGTRVGLAVAVGGGVAVVGLGMTATWGKLALRLQPRLIRTNKARNVNFIKPTCRFGEKNCHTVSLEQNRVMADHN
jgi:hypothetical protein